MRRGQDLKSEMSHKSYRPLTVLSFRLQRIVGQALFGGVLQLHLYALEERVNLRTKLYGSG